MLVFAKLRISLLRVFFSSGIRRGGFSVHTIKIDPTNIGTVRIPMHIIIGSRLHRLRPKRQTKEQNQAVKKIGDYFFMDFCFL